MIQSSYIEQKERGVALIAVLAVLTILALIASTFVVFVGLSRETSKAGMAKVQSDMLAQSAVEHAVSLLRQDVREHPRWDDLSEEWHAHFSSAGKAEEETVDVDKLPGMTGKKKAEDARWIYVKSKEGQVIGRYAVMVEDEAAKINVNAASAIGGKNQNQGIDTFEIMLSDGKGSGLPIGNKMAEKILEYRYGKDKQPGQALRDDNVSGAMHATDKIDNDADSIYDEKGEGIDEPHEYSAGQPVWDDRAFSSVEEMADYCSDKPLPASSRRLLRKYSTVHSNNRETFWDANNRKWQKKINLNIADRTQVHKVLLRANEEIPFEPSSKNLRSLAVNMLDYRDENHVLSTMGSEYGVEAVCFNEIMANEASMVFQTDWSQDYVVDRDPDLHTPTRQAYYGWNLNFPNQAMRVRSLQKAGNTYTVKIDEPKTKKFADKGIPFYDMDLPWEPNVWKDAEAEIRIDGGGTYKFVVESSAGGNDRTVKMTSVGTVNYDSITGKLDKAYIRLIGPDGSCSFRKPEVHMKWWFPTGRQCEHNEYYYRAYFIQGTRGGNVFEVDVDGDISSYSVTKMDKLKYIYNGGKAMRANRYGYIPLIATSSRKCSEAANRYFEQLFSLFTRPDIVELINVSDKPISLRNWSVVVNTGVAALTLDTIDMARHYSVERNGAYEDPNPVIQPGGYFYLANNREIFDIHYANGDGEYGSSADEDIPLFELAEKKWGITYPIVEVIQPYYLKVDGADWEPNIMRNELMVILTDRTKSEYFSGAPFAVAVPDGLFMTIARNTRNVLGKWGGWTVKQLGIEAGDKVMIFGLPRKGGFVSFTLKNQYGQIAARTTTYGTVEEDERGFSTEKADPTHYNWVKVKTPSIGGTERKARNRGTYSPDYARPHIKNNRFTSAGEIQKVRRADDWENLGTQKGQKAIMALKALSRYFTTAGVRLDAEEDAHISGWKPAFGTAINSGMNIIETADTDWGPGIWAGQRLKMVTGELAGEEFVVTNSRKNGLLLDGYSTDKKVKLRVRAGDKFSVGPGYSTPMYYTRKSGEEGIWEWQNKKLEKMSYALYLFGLNDSIKTTEFLEENWNANLDAMVFNYATREYDMLPLDDSDLSHHSFVKKKGSRRLQFNKGDGVYCGMIKPEHVSPKGGIRLKLTAHNLENTDCSGFAWFDFAYLAPVSTAGKININTAPERVIAALKGITPKLARNVVKGIDNNGRARLKPYKEASDILEVAGITPDMYRDFCNLITTRSDQFRVAAIAQTIEDVDGDGNFDKNKGDRILSESCADVVVDRGGLTDSNTDTKALRVIH